VSSCFLVVVIVVVLVVTLVLLVNNSNDTSDNHGDNVGIELPAETVKGTVGKLLVEEDLVGEVTSEHGDTSY
jgi:preprotein translocase subunit SecG